MKIISARNLPAGCAIVLLYTLSPGAWAQSSRQVDVKQGKVLYVSGNDVVVRTTDNAVKHYVVPSDFKFNVDGKEIGVQDLRAGTVLTQTITTTTEEKMVTKVLKVDAKVIEAKPPYLTVGVDDKIKRVKVPAGTTFTVDGKQKQLSELREGMRLKGTVVTSAPTTVVSKARSVTGQTPETAVVITPIMEGVLLIEEVDIVP